MSEAIPRVVLDSNVIFSRVLHELFGRAGASLRLLDVIWSDELLAESERVLIGEKPLSPQVAARWIGYLREAFPNGHVELANAAASLELAAVCSTGQTQDRYCRPFSRWGVLTITRTAPRAV